MQVIECSKMSVIIHQSISDILDTGIAYKAITPLIVFIPDT